MGSVTQWGAAGSPEAIVHWLMGHLPTGRIINVGAGAGTTIARDQQRCVNVDLVVPSGPQHELTVADALHLPFASAAFDGALAKDIIEHTLDPLAVLDEIRRVCRPGGTIVVTVPRAIPRAVWADPTHVRGFTDAALMRALESTGWEPRARPRRIGGFPGAGRLKLEPHLVTIMQVPGIGHWYGTNWFVVADRR